MVNLDFLRSIVEAEKASDLQLYTALFFLLFNFILILIQSRSMITKINKNYSIFSSPFNYYITIFFGLFLIILNEIIILVSIILTNQKYTYLGREKSLFIVIGLGFFVFGWTKIVLFNLSLKPSISKILNLSFLGVMVFYVFAVITTTLITFQIIKTASFVGLGYSTAVVIYGSFLLIDIFALFYIAMMKRKESRYQAWIGFLLFISLLLIFISVIFNVLPLVIIGKVNSEIHLIFNYIVEPIVYFITVTISMKFLIWVLFNPDWLKDRIIEKDS